MDVPLSQRQQDLLRRVVEEYVSTGQPVGSKTLVERGSLAVSSSTVRNDLAELERRGLMMHPHTSAGRVPTEAGYRLYVDELLMRPEARPGRDRPRAARRAGRGRGGAAGDDRGAVAGDATARARLGAAVRVGDRAARRGAPAADERRDGRRDHLDRQRHEAALRVSRAGRPRARHLGGRLPQRAARRRQDRLADDPARLRRRRALARASNRSCSRSATRSSIRPRRTGGCTSAAPRACSRRCGSRRSVRTGA